MTNAELFRTIFNGIMVTEVWAMPEAEFLEWLNSEATYSLDDHCMTEEGRLTYRDSDRRPLFNEYGKHIYCSTQATADVICKYEELLSGHDC